MEQDINKTTACVLPFIHLATHPNGMVTPCCKTDMTSGLSFSHSDKYGIPGVMDDQNFRVLGRESLKDIANAKNFCGIRLKMLNGEEPKECAGCYKLERTGEISKRIYENWKYPHTIDELKSMIDKTGALKELNYKTVELRIGNVCNLKCLTCNPMSSTKWNEDIAKLPEKFQSGYYSLDKSFSTWYKDEKWYDELLSSAKDLEEIYINGGEPMLIKEHLYFLQKLCDLGINKKIRLVYSINLTLITPKVIELWKQFKQVELNVSIDDLGERNDYIRYPSKFTATEVNLNLLNNNSFDIKVIQTVSVLNVYNIGNFYEYFTQKGFKVEHNYVYWPEYLHVSLFKGEIPLDKLPEDKAKRLSDELNKDYSIFYDDFVAYIKSIDYIRGLSINDYLTEFSYL